jgi:hypothetical protein
MSVSPRRAIASRTRAIWLVALLGSAFALQWAGGVLLSQAGVPGPAWLPARTVIRARPGDGAFVIDSSQTSSLPGPVTGGMTVGFRADYRIWGRGAHPQNADAHVVHVPHWSRLAEPVDVDSLAETGYFRVIEIAGGWPLPSVCGRVHLRIRYGGVGATSTWVDPIYRGAIPRSMGGPAGGATAGDAYSGSMLPIRPLLVGSIVNTTVFAAVLLGLTAGGRWCWSRLLGGRRRAWIRDGRCGRCGYPLDDTPRCPECGQPAGAGGAP